MKTSLLQRLDNPALLQTPEVCLKNGAVDFRKGSPLFETNAKVKETALAFFQEIYQETRQRPQGLNTQQVKVNLSTVAQNLANRTSDPAIQQQISRWTKGAINSVARLNSPAKKEASGTDFVMRRVSRYFLYKLAQGGALGALTARLSIPEGTKAVVGGLFGSEGVSAKVITKMFGEGGVAHTAAAAAGTGINAAFSVFSSAMVSDLLGFLMITEGPGVIGHLARRLTPQPVKKAYNFVMPNFAQRGINWVTHTDKPVANGLDYLIDGFKPLFA